MQQLELLSIENPCINVCQSNKRGYCLGCFRSRDERFNWNNFSAEEKGKILALCKQRSRRRKSRQKKQQAEIPVVTLGTTSSHEKPGEKENNEKRSAAVIAKAPPPKETAQDMGLDLFDL